MDAGRPASDDEIVEEVTTEVVLDPRTQVYRYCCC